MRSIIQAGGKTLFEPPLAADAPRGLGRAMTGGGDKAKRQANDFYPTPRDVTRALLRVEGQYLANVCPGPVWEPCGRGGAILRELRAAGFATVASDIVADPAEGVSPADLLALKQPFAAKVVTNPPFALAAEMIVHLLARLKVDYLALLLKSQFWHAEVSIHAPVRGRRAKACLAAVSLMFQSTPP